MWENYWPQHGDFWPGINNGKKYVMSATRCESAWNNRSFIRRVEEIQALKELSAADLHVWGSSELVPLLLQHKLVDELRLKIHPVILGAGKRLFAKESTAQSFRLMQCRQTTTGVLLANYEYAGDVRVAQIGIEE